MTADPAGLYYRLPGHARWLDGGSPYQIGGRDTDLGELGESLRSRIRDLYPVNGVPGHICEAADALVARLSEAETAVAELIGLVSADQLQRIAALATAAPERPGTAQRESTCSQDAQPPDSRSAAAGQP